MREHILRMPLYLLNITKDYFTRLVTPIFTREQVLEFIDWIVSDDGKHFTKRMAKIKAFL